MCQKLSISVDFPRAGVLSDSLLVNFQPRYIAELVCTITITGRVIPSRQSTSMFYFWDPKRRLQPSRVPVLFPPS